MNERIKELAKQAGISTAEYYRNLDDTKMSYSKGIVSEWSDEFKQQLNLEPYLRVKAMEGSTLEKFAELIVLECADQCTTDGPFGAEVVWGKQFHDKIKKHFGVE